MKKWIAVGIILFISLAVNVWLLSGKGIVVNNYTTNHQEQYQQQWQGMLSINQWVAQGNEIEWKYVECINQSKDIAIELNKLHPLSSLYAKIYRSRIEMDDAVIWYPNIFTKTKDELKK